MIAPKRSPPPPFKLAATVAVGIGWLFAAPSLSVAQQADHRSFGPVHDAFTLDGLTIWTAEDGGRIRRGTYNPTTNHYDWSFQSVTNYDEDTLKRIFLLPDALTGWAVGADGRVLETHTGGEGSGVGNGWTQLWRAPSVVDVDEYEPLWDVHFLNAAQGWVLGARGMWYWEGSVPWQEVALVVEGGDPADHVDPSSIELYALDVVQVAGGALLGLASGEPGLIFKMRTPTVWEIAFDLHSKCEGSTIPECLKTAICGNGPVHAEPWDIEISRNPQAPLALCVGGAASNCGYVLASTDAGYSWDFEYHECRCTHVPPTCPCDGDPAYEDQQTTATWHLKKFFELYGVAIFSGDNSAIASGYKGQIVVRDPTSSPVLWRDRTTYNARNLDNLNAVTLAGYGVDAEKSLTATATNGKAVLTSTGGWIRTTTDGGDTWTIEKTGRPWRIRDVLFIDDNRGWLVSQYSLIARTINAGASWTVDNSATLALTDPQLQALATDEFHTVGVAVGANGASATNPRILVNTNIQDTQTTDWLAPAEIHYVQGYDGDEIEEMHEVTWAGGQEFWTVGTHGLIYHCDASSGGPAQTWNQFVPPGEAFESFRDFALEGVSFSGTNDGVFVGHRTVGTQLLGKAYHYNRAGTTVTWTEIGFAQPEVDLRILSDVAFKGDTIYAVGERDFGAYSEGVVFKSTRPQQSSVFPPFTAQSSFPECTVGENPNDVPVLSEVEIDPGDTIWLGGQCGRLWYSRNGTNWSPLQQSQTDAAVRGMSFPDDDTGFVAGHRTNATTQCIVRVMPNDP